MGADASDVTLWESVRTSDDRRGTRPVQSNTQNDREQLVCLQCLPVVVRDEVKLCGLGCGSFFKTQSRAFLEGETTFSTHDGVKRRRVCSPPRRNAGEGKHHRLSYLFCVGCGAK
eukprot:4188296-Amphidinium_carterae.1